MGKRANNKKNRKNRLKSNNRNIPYEKNSNNYIYLKSMLFNLFVWEGLPDYMPPNYVEKLLHNYDYNDGDIDISLNTNYVIGAYMFNDNLTISQVVPSGKLNIYGEHYKYKPIFINDTTANEISRENIVLIYPHTYISDIEEKVIFYSNLLDELEMAISVNISNQKKASIIYSNEETISEIDNIISAVNKGANQIVRLSSKNGIENDIVDIKELSLSKDFKVENYLVARQIIINNYLTAIGINNSGLEKKERKITNEVDVSAEESLINLTNMLLPREVAVKQINKKFGTNISVSKFNSNELLEKEEGNELIKDNTIKEDNKGDDDE